MSVLRRPWFVVLFLMIGVLCGVFWKDFAYRVGSIGYLYLNLLQMTVIPVLITAVVSSLGRLIETHGLSKKFANIFWVMGVFLAVAAAAGALAGFLFRPGSGLSEEVQTLIGQYLNQSDVASGNKPQPTAGFYSFLAEMIPINPLAAISEGKHLAILFFSLLLGSAIGFVGAKSREVTLQVFEALYDAQLKIIDWTLLALPFGIFCIISDQVARSGAQIILAMSYFVVLSLFLCALMVLGQMLLIQKKSGFSLAQTFGNLREVLLVAFVTRSSFATIPTAMDTLIERFGRNAQDVRLIIPLGINLSRQGSAMYVAVAVYFFSQIYNLDFGAYEFLLTITLSVVAGMVPSELVGLIPLVFTPLGLPIEVAVALLLAIDLLLDPFLTLVNVLGNCASTMVLARGRSEA